MSPSPLSGPPWPWLGPALGALLLAGCDAAAPPPRPEMLRIGPVPAAWATDVLPATGTRPAWVAATSHRDGFLGLWAVDGQRQVRPLGSYPQAGFHPDAPRWVDLDGDGRPALLLAAEGRGEIQLWRLDEAGTGLRLTATLPSLDKPLDVLAADLDGDGHEDLIVTPYEGASFGLLWGKGGFDFDYATLPPTKQRPAGAAEAPTAPGGPPGSGVADSGDGAANLPGATKTRPFGSRRASSREPETFVSQPRVVDWDGDGRPDLLWCDRKRGGIYFAKNLGDRVFEIRELRAPAEGTPRQIALADLDGDGQPDLVAALETGGKALILYNDGQGGVRDTEEIPAPSWGYSNVAAVGGPEPLLVLTEDPRVIVARRAADGWRLRQLPTGVFPLDPHLVDVDGDGQLDLLLANSGGDDLTLIFGPLWERAQELTP